MTFDFTVKEFILGNGTGTPTFQFYRRGFNLGGSGSQPSWRDVILSGNTALTLVNAKADGLNYLKLFGGTEQRSLPKGYTQYKYLRSTGTQYIDLGYKGNGNTKVKIKFKYHTATNATSSGRAFGSRSTSTSDAFAIGTSTGVVSATGNKIFWCYDGQSFFVDDTEFGLDEWQTVVFSAKEHTINGITVGNNYTVTTFETPSTLKLFGFDNNGAMSVGFVDIALCQLWDNGVLVRDVVPAGDGTTYGMYDKVSGTMLPNAGTGNFIAGSTAVPTPDVPIDIVCNNGTIKPDSELPAGYRRLLGYSCNNNCYWQITDFHLRGSDTVRMSFSLTAACNVFGCYQSTSATDNYDLYATTTVGGKYLRYGNGTYISYWAQTDLGKRFDVIFSPTGTTGMPEDSTWTQKTFESENDLFIGATSATGTSAKLKGNVYGNFVVDGRLKLIPCERLYDNSLGYYDTYTNTFYEPTGTPTSLGYADSYTIEIVADGTTETVQDSLNNTATAEMLLGVGDYIDEQEVLTGAVTRRVGVTILDGSENWNKSNSYAGSFYTSNFTPYDGAKVAQYTNIYCTHGFAVLHLSDYLSADVGAVYWSTSTTLNFKYDDGTATVEQFKAWLANQSRQGTPVIIVYPLDTATTESVTGQTLTTQQGTNVIEITQASMDNLELEVSYKAGVEVTVTEIENAQLDNSVEVTIN